MLHDIREVKHLLEDIFDGNNDDYDSADWDYAKHTAIDETCVAMDLKDVKMVVNNYGILEIMAQINNEYGAEFVAGILERPIDMQYRCLIYYILDEFVENWKNTVNNDSDDDDEEDDSDDDLSIDDEVVEPLTAEQIKDWEEWKDFKQRLADGKVYY
jgi:hypothetical protein